MEDASDASKHAGRGSLSRGSWNKCGNLAPKLRDGGSVAAGILIYELKSKTHFVLDKGCTLKNFLTTDILLESCVKRRETKNLFILTGNYRLDNYEYYEDDSLLKLIEKSYQYFDVVILLVNKSIYDSYTVISLIKSDFNIISLRADIDTFREFNSYILFLREKQQIPADKTKFVAFQYDASINLDQKAINEITEDNYLGCIRYSRRRARYRNLTIPFVRRMEKEGISDYINILNAFSIIPEATFAEKLRDWFCSFAVLLRPFIKRAVKIFGGRVRSNANSKLTP